MRGVIDTSVFIAIEQRRPLDRARLPRHPAVSTVTLAELETGVRLARHSDARLLRAATLATARTGSAVLPVDQHVASAFAEIMAAARRAGRRPGTQDLWIAATAKAHAIAVYTQDGDFDALPGVLVVRL